MVEPAPPSRIRPLEKAGRGTTKTGPGFPRKKRQPQSELSLIRVFLSIRFHVSEMVE